MDIITTWLAASISVFFSLTSSVALPTGWLASLGCTIVPGLTHCAVCSLWSTCPSPLCCCCLCYWWTRPGVCTCLLTCLFLPRLQRDMALLPGACGTPMIATHKWSFSGTWDGLISKCTLVVLIMGP